MLARFVVGSHLRSHPAFDEVDEARIATSLDADIIPQDLLRKYIMYARDRIRPKLHALDQERLSRLYADLRRESLSTGSYLITVLHLGNMIRMAEASAKMHLHEFVRYDDIDTAIRATVESFVSAQKMSVKNFLERGFRKYLSSNRDHEEVLSFILGGIIKDRARFAHFGGSGNRAQQSQQAGGVISVPVVELEKRAKEMADIHDVRPFLGSKLFSANGYRCNEATRTINKVFTTVCGIDGNIYGCPSVRQACA